MKKAAVVFLFLVAVLVLGQARADSIKLDNAPISNVVRLYFSEINRDAYSLPDELIKDDRRVSLSVSGSADKLRAQLAQILTGYGYEIVKARGLYSVRKVAPEGVAVDEREVFIYRPKARTAQYLVDVLRNIYPGVTQGAPGLPKVVPVTGEYAPTSATAQLENRTDRIVFRGSPAQVADLQRHLAVLDVVPPSIELQVYLIEHTRTNEKQSGFQALVSTLGNFSLSVGALPAAGDTLRFSTGSVDLAIAALRNDNRFSVYTSPKLLLVDQKKARLVVGQDVPVLAATTTTIQGVTQSIEYRSSGVIMEASANILSDAVEIDTTIEVSSFAQTTTGVSTSPTLTKRSLQSSTVLADGVSVLFGGLSAAKENEGSSGLSFMPKALRLNTKGADESELFVLMSARRI